MNLSVRSVLGLTALCLLAGCSRGADESGNATENNSAGQPAVVPFGPHGQVIQEAVKSASGSCGDAGSCAAMQSVATEVCDSAPILSIPALSDVQPQAYAHVGGGLTWAPVSIDCSWTSPDTASGLKVNASFALRDSNVADHNPDTSCATVQTTNAGSGGCVESGGAVIYQPVSQAASIIFSVPDAVLAVTVSSAASPSGVPVLTTRALGDLSGPLGFGDFLDTYSAYTSKYPAY